MSFHRILLQGATEWCTIDLLNAKFVIASSEKLVLFLTKQSAITKFLLSESNIIIEFTSSEPIGFSLELVVETSDETGQIDWRIDSSHELELSTESNQLRIISAQTVSLIVNNGEAPSALHVIIEDTEWYHNSAQASTSNGILKVGTRVYIVNLAGSFSQIKTEDGTVSGFVASDALTPVAVNPGDDREASAEVSNQLTAEATPCVENLPPWDPNRWRPAKSLKQLLSQVNILAPNRRKGEDGIIGDLAHQNRTSDHNPHVLGQDGKGVVTALDITHDPQHQCDCGTLASVLERGKDPRVKYVIWNRRIMNSSAIGSAAAWSWRPYAGDNPHTKHIHISVKCDPVHFDSTATWELSTTI